MHGSLHSNTAEVINFQSLYQFFFIRNVREYQKSGESAVLLLLFGSKGSNICLFNKKSRKRSQHCGAMGKVSTSMLASHRSTFHVPETPLLIRLPAYGFEPMLLMWETLAPDHSVCNLTFKIK